MIAQVTIKLIINVGFLILFCIRVNKLDKMASNSDNSRNVFQLIKLFTVLFIIFLLILDIILSYEDSGYWMHQYEDYSLADIILILNFSIQLYIIQKQKKKDAIKAISMKLFWLVLSICDIITIAVVSVTHFS